LITCRETLSCHSAMILPGFRMFCGSSERLISRITSSVAVLCSSSRYLIFFWPTPCSPVQVPSIASARLTSRSMKPRQRSTSSSFSRSTSGWV
jgi:hypothetical protein